MTAPKLTDLSPRAQAEVRAQLRSSPHPRTVRIELAHELAPARPVRFRRGREVDATSYFTDAGLPAPVREHRFHATRKWRFDYAWPAQKIALEVDGGLFIQGRHSRGAGIIGDMEKTNAAALAGWRVLRVTPQQLRTEQTLEMMGEILK